jgi:hypothetical protein
VVDKAMVETHQAEVKLALARKYDRLAATARSTPKQKKYLRHAAEYRRQAANITTHG